MNIAIIGAAGRTGRCLTELALLHGHHVTAAVRDASHIDYFHERLRVVQSDVRDAGSLRVALQGQEVVLCALGGPRRGVTVYSEGARNIVRAMDEMGVRRLVFLSNYGVLGEKAQGLVTNMMLHLGNMMLRDTLADHRRALDIIRASGREWIAVRPMALTDAAGTGRYRVDTHGLPARATRIARADVAHFMLRAAISDEFVAKVPAVAY